MLKPSNALGGWALMHALHALEETGVFAHLVGRKRGASAQSIARACSTDEEVLRATLRFVSINAPGLLQQSSKDTFVLGSQHDSEGFQNILHFSRAYAPVLHGLAPLLTKQKMYGKDVVRDHTALSISSELYVRPVVAELVSLLREESPEVIVDVGCGSGALVKEASKALGTKGVGIDEALPSERKSTHKGATFLVGDAAKPSEWTKHLPEGKTVFVMSMVQYDSLL